MEIKWSRHAREMLSERGIDEEWARELSMNPTQSMIRRTEIEATSRQFQNTRAESYEWW